MTIYKLQRCSGKLKQIVHTRTCQQNFLKSWFINLQTCTCVGIYMLIPTLHIQGASVCFYGNWNDIISRVVAISL